MQIFSYNGIDDRVTNIAYHYQYQLNAAAIDQ